MKTLQMGSRGDDVKVLQIALVAAGYDVGPSGADGIFGQYTEQAVMDFQHDHALSTDGIVGVATATALGLIHPDAAPTQPAPSSGMGIGLPLAVGGVLAFLGWKLLHKPM